MERRGTLKVLVVFLLIFENSLENHCFFWKDAHYIDGVCYHISDERVNWSTAEVSCERKYGQLAHLKKLGENSLFQLSIVSTAEFNWWTGRVPDANNRSLDSEAHGQTPQIQKSCPYISASESTSNMLRPESDSCDVTKNYVCEKGALQYNYIIVLPRRVADDSTDDVIVVTSDVNNFGKLGEAPNFTEFYDLLRNAKICSDVLEMVYLFLKFMSNATHVLTREGGWTNLNRNFTLNITGNMTQNNGISSNAIKLEATHSVKVTVYSRQDNMEIPLVTLPNNDSGLDFCISVNESCTIDYLTVTALEGPTEVMFVYRDDSLKQQFFNVTEKNNSEGTVTVLAHLQTLRLEVAGMTNTRVAMHASDTVSVFIWTTCSHTTQVRLLQPASNPYRCFATPLCCSCKGPTGEAPHDLAMAKKQTQLLQKELKVLFKDTGAYMRTKVSQPDSRPSSHGLAALGIAVMVLVFGAIISADVMSLVCKSYRKPKPSKAKTKGKGSRKDKIEMMKVSTILP